MTATILVIEDNVDDQQLYQRALKNCDCRLVMIPTAEIALARLPDLKPDLIMLDYKLPDLDGLGFLEKLTQHSASAIPILMLTGEGSEAVAVEAMKKGADDYLVKDIGGGYLRLLPSTIERVMDAHKQRMQTRHLQALHKMVIDTSIDGFWMTDLTGNLLEVNESYANMSGYSVKELVSMHIRQLETIGQSAEEVEAHIAKIIAQGHDRFETHHRHKDGHQLDIEVSATYMAELQRLCIFCRDITDRKKAEAEIRNLAFYDALTQLPNRRLLDDRLVKAIAASKRNGRYGALMFLDLDNFKPLNDQHGHLAGDLLLVEAARRISSCVREMDTVARFGGDEFMVMLGELDVDKAESIAQSRSVAEKIRTLLSEPYVLTFQQGDKKEMTFKHHCTSSIGVDLYIGLESRAEDVVKHADLAMYRAKEAGRNQVCFYDDANT